MHLMHSLCTFQGLKRRNKMSEMFDSPEYIAHKMYVALLLSKYPKCPWWQKQCNKWFGTHYPFTDAEWKELQNTKKAWLDTLSQ